MSVTMWYDFFHDLLLASAETLYVVVLCTILTILLGMPLGFLLFHLKRIHPSPTFYRPLSALINIFRSIPFIILIIALIPVTRFLVGSSIGINATLIPLTIGAIPLFARLVENALDQIPAGLLETGMSMGASSRQILSGIYLPEAMPALIQAATVTAITLVNYSAMAGVVGGGGLGTLAYNHGYLRYQPLVIVATIIILVLLVQFIQWMGDRFSVRFKH